MASAHRIRTAVLACVLGALPWLGSGCGSPAANQDGVVKIAPAEAQTLIQQHQGDEGFVILDVRNPEKFAAGHIDGAVNVCFLCSSFADDLAALDPAKTYLVYCASGNRSGQATAQMGQRGFAQLYDLAGGVNRWKADGLPVVP